MKKLRRIFIITLAIHLSACGGGNGGNASSVFDSLARCFEPTIKAQDLCDPTKTQFTLESTNPYYPLKVGSITILEGEEDGESLRVERRVLSETAVIDGVTTRVLEHKSFINGEIHEIAKNYYVESTNGTVCYFGEDVEFYEDGVFANTQGTWKAENGAKPGVIMPASPKAGDAYFQEGALGIAEDMGRIISASETRTYAGKTYNNVVVVLDSNPIDTEDTCKEEEKAYIAGIGEVQDVALKLVSHTPGQ